MASQNSPLQNSSGSKRSNLAQYSSFMPTMHVGTYIVESLFEHGNYTTENKIISQDDPNNPNSL